MAEALMKLVEGVVNDPDLDKLTMKEFRSILIHMQDAMSDGLEGDQSKEGEMSLEMLAKYVL